MYALLIQKSVVGYCDLNFNDAPTEDDVMGVTKWLNRVIQKGAVFFAQVYDGDTIKLVAFSVEIPENYLKNVERLEWRQSFEYIDRGTRIDAD